MYGLGTEGSLSESMLACLSALTLLNSGLRAGRGDARHRQPLAARAVPCHVRLALSDTVINLIGGPGGPAQLGYSDIQH